MHTPFPSSLDADAVQQLTEWAIMHGQAFRKSDGTARHAPFSLSPQPISQEELERLTTVIPLISRVIDRVSENHHFLQHSLGPAASADPFFGRLLEMHQQLHANPGEVRRIPLLVMRTDFMQDQVFGPKVIEFNGIAAGMAPFGQRVTELHRFVQQQWPGLVPDLNKHQLVENQGMHLLARAMVNAAVEVNRIHGGEGKPTFLMVVQGNEDNVYDQHLLAQEIQSAGVRTIRRTFDQLADQLYTGDNHRLMLEGEGAIDLVYLRAGYQYSDYFSLSRRDAICCHTLCQTRLFIEKHAVAVNATIGQQLATSKAMQLILTNMTPEEYASFGLTAEDANQIKSVLAEMRQVSPASIKHFIENEDINNWVLKNQGEGGGHCIFGSDIIGKLHTLPQADHAAWAVMQKLTPETRRALVIRDSKAHLVDELVSEIGLFSVMFNGNLATDLDGYAGYLIRSKPAHEGEGGVHSGQGVLDSMQLLD